MLSRGKIDDGITKYNEALDLVPSPKEDWEASTWTYTALGDAYFLKSHFKEASNFFYDALNCPGGIENPFINLRLGQSLFELNQLDKSKEFLLRAYMLEGTEIFDDEDPKYFEIIRNI